MSRPVRNQRLFVAVYPPLEVLRSMVQALDAVRGLPAFEPTPPELVHLTVLFLGDVAAKDLSHVCESIERSTAGIGAMILCPRILVTLPRADAARLIACAIDAPGTLVDLHRRLALRLATNRRQKQPDGDYSPHVTLGRFPSPTPVTPLERAVAIAPFRIDKIHLMRTVLRPGGTRHELVHTFALE
ncbi:MAG: RNA 2',3'-cyclic phosphodiesterase [Planctomycetes bacterium]|nr:RNA 2',3'-cyclic phosphodiesterase [Planctomycetota bacterium]